MLCDVMYTVDKDTGHKVDYNVFELMTKRSLLWKTIKKNIEEIYYSSDSGSSSISSSIKKEYCTLCNDKLPRVKYTTQYCMY